MLLLPWPPPWLCSISLSVLELSPLLLSAFFLPWRLLFFSSFLVLIGEGGGTNEGDEGPWGEVSGEAMKEVTAGEGDGGCRRLLGVGLWEF